MLKVTKPKVLFIAPLPPPVHGSSVVSQQIMKSVTINEAFQCDWVNMSTSRKVNEIGRITIIKLFRLVCALLKTLWLLITNQYTLCYLAISCHGGPFLKDVPFVLLCKLFRKKIIIHQHNKGMSNDVDKWPYRMLMPLVYKNTKVILLSWYLYPDIKKIVPKEDVMICPNGISAKGYTFKQHTSPIPRLLFLSNLLPSKGVFVLLDALLILQRNGYSFICNFVGGETKEINAKRFANEVNKRGLTEMVIYHGRKYGAEKEMHFCNSDLFVFPTYYSNECFPLVILEAMAHKLPVVTTDEGGILDVIIDGENGCICKKNNSQDLANKIEILLKDEKLRKKIGSEGRNKYEQNYTLECFECHFIECLKSVLSDSDNQGCCTDKKKKTL